MEISTLLTDDDAVSPVIGVILMVAITVILAAVIAAFVLGLGDTSDVSPQVTFDYDYDEDAEQLDIKVESGDSFTASQVSFEGANFDASGSTWADETSKQEDSSVGSGDRATLGDGTAGNGSDVSSNFELEIVWEAEGGGDSSILSERTGPDA